MSHSFFKVLARNGKRREEIEKILHIWNNVITNIFYTSGKNQVEGHIWEISEMVD